MQDLNLRPPACEAGALPTELIVRACDFRYLRVIRQDPSPSLPENVPVSVPAAQFPVL